MSTQANFDVRIFDVTPGVEEAVWERISLALKRAIVEALAGEDLDSVSVVIRGPEILSLFN